MKVYIVISLLQRTLCCIIFIAKHMHQTVLAHSRFNNLFLVDFAFDCGVWWVSIGCLKAAPGISFIKLSVSPRLTLRPHQVSLCIEADTDYTPRPYLEDSTKLSNPSVPTHSCIIEKILSRLTSLLWKSPVSMHVLCTHLNGLYIWYYKHLQGIFGI